MRERLATLGLILSFAACGSEKSDTAVSVPRVSVSSHDRPNADVQRCLGAAASGTGLSEFEPYAAVDPRNPQTMIAAWMAQTAETTVFLAARSTDGGRTFASPVALPFTSCAGGPSNVPVASDPYVVFGPDGRAYVVGIGISGDLQAGRIDQTTIFVVTSDDGGATWQKPVVALAAADEPAGYDNVSLVVDPADPQRILVATTAFGPRAPGSQVLVSEIRVAVSTDGARTFGSPSVAVPKGADSVRLSAPILYATPSAMGIAYVRADQPGVWPLEVVRSTDRGVSWSQPRVVVPLPEPAPTRALVGDYGLLSASDIVSVATRGEAVAIAYPAETEAGIQTIELVTSADGGGAWGSPRRVDRGNGNAFLPNVAYNERDEIGVSYLQAPERAALGSPVRTTMNLAVFGTATPRYTVVDEFDLALSGLEEPRSTQDLLGTGDYQALVAQRDGFLPVYVHTRCPGGAATCALGAAGGTTELIVARP